jgi:excinuclease UvrABC ATPase subunit
MMNMPVSDLAPILDEIDDPRGRSLAVQIKEYLKRMTDVGVGYLSLSRRTDTLSRLRGAGK